MTELMIITVIFLLLLLFLSVRGIYSNDVRHVHNNGSKEHRYEQQQQQQQQQ